MRTSKSAAGLTPILRLLWLATLLLTSRATSGFAASEESREPSSESPGRDWPLVRGDALATGVARSKLTDKPDLLGKFPVPKGAFTATPIVYDGKVFLGDLDGVFRAI